MGVGKYDPAATFAGHRLVALSLADTGADDPGQSEPVEIGITVLDDGVVGDTLTWLVRPAGPISVWATRAHGIGQPDVAGAPPLGQVAAEVTEALSDRTVVALRAVHHHDLLAATRHRCQACTAGEFQVTWPCRTRRTLDDGLRLGYPPPADPPEPVPDPHEAFALAVLAIHDILPAAGGHPPCCRACLVPPAACPIWALADGFLGITWTGPADPTTGTAGSR